MPIRRFKASTKYGDFLGTSAADEADASYLTSWAKERAGLRDGEFLLGIELTCGENAPGKHRDPVFVSVLIAEPRDHETVKDMIDARGDKPIPVRVVNVRMSVAEFFGLFKRVEISFSRADILGTREYEFSEG